MIDIQKIELELEELKERRVKTATLVKAIEFSKYDSPKLFRSSTDGEKSSSLNYAPRSNEQNLKYLDQLNNELREIDQLIFEKRKQLRGLIDAINDRLNSWGIFDAEKIEDAKIHESIISPQAQKAIQLAIRAEDEAISTDEIKLDIAWKKLNSKLNLDSKSKKEKKSLGWASIFGGLNFSYGSAAIGVAGAFLTIYLLSTVTVFRPMSPRLMEQSELVRSPGVILVVANVKSSVIQWHKDLLELKLSVVTTFNDDGSVQLTFPKNEQSIALLISKRIEIEPSSEKNVTLVIQAKDGK